MKSAVLEKPVATGALDADRLRALLLVRVASAADGVSKARLAADFAPFAAHRVPAAQWRLLDHNYRALSAPARRTNRSAGSRASIA